MTSKENQPKKEATGKIKEYGIAFLPPDEMNGPGKKVTEPLPSVLPDTAALGLGLTRRRRSSQISSLAPRPGKPRPSRS